jgi:separase
MNSTYTKKESRAVVMLMGCETVDLDLQGRYTPRCYPYSYLMVGCPAVFANLWKVLDVEIDILGAKLYENWLLESSKVVDKDGIAAFMPKARNACNYPFLTGASTVCYGIPTKIYKKDNILSSHLPSKRKHSEFNS